MKEVCGLNPEKENYGWCFDCVPEENSLYFEVNGVRFELPSVDLVLLKSRELLGEPVEARFGKDFPIRFPRYSRWWKFECTSASYHTVYP